MIGNGKWYTKGNDREWWMAGNMEWLGMQNERQWGVSGNVDQWEMVDNHEWQNIANTLQCIGKTWQWVMTDTREWQTMTNDKPVDDDRQWGMTDNGEWQIMKDDKPMDDDTQWRMTHNGEWHTMGNDKLEWQLIAQMSGKTLQQFQIFKRFVWTISHCDCVKFEEKRIVQKMHFPMKVVTLRFDWDLTLYSGLFAQRTFWLLKKGSEDIF